MSGPAVTPNSAPCAPSLVGACSFGWYTLDTRLMANMRVYAAAQVDCHIIYVESIHTGKPRTAMLGCIYNCSQETADIVVEILNLFIRRVFD